MLARCAAWAASRHQGLLFLGVVLAHALLNSALLFPYPHEANQIDYPKYIRAGQRIVNALAEGRFYLPTYEEYPFGPLLYAVLYVPFARSDDWLTLTGWAGRLLIYGGIWLSVYLIARRLGVRYLGVAAAVVLFAAPVFPELLSVGPHGLFPALAGFALWQTLGYVQQGRQRHLAAASALLGLVALTHLEGYLLLGSLAAVAAAAALWGPPALRAARARAAAAVVCLLPFALVVGGYLVAARAVHGSFSGAMGGLGALGYLYFEMSQHGEPVDAEALPASIAETRRLFGTPEENGQSLLRALLRNPAAMAGRALRSAGEFVGAFAAAYGGLAGYGLALAGLVYWARRRPLVALALALWYALLAAHLPLWINLKVMGFIYAPTVVLIGTGTVWLLGWAFERARAGRGLRVAAAGAAALGVMAVAALQHHAPVEVRAPRLGTTTEERVALLMRERLPRGTPIASVGLMVPYMAKMEARYLLLFTLGGAPLERDALLAWLRESGADLVYLSPELQLATPALYGLVRTHVRGEELFTVEEQDPKRQAFCRERGLECTYRVMRVPRE